MDKRVQNRQVQESYDNAIMRQKVNVDRFYKSLDYVQ